jgi:hypothetical protein
MDKGQIESAAGSSLTEGISMGANLLIPGLGSVVGPIAGMLVGDLVQGREEKRQLNKELSAVGRDTNPYMANGGLVPSSKIWAMYGDKDKLKKRMADGGFLSGKAITPNDIKSMQKDLNSKGFYDGKIDGVAGRKTLSGLINMDEMSVLKNGGEIGVPDLAKYIGPSHENGGILVDSKGMPTESNPVAEVEGGEMILNIDNESYVFSKRLKI